MKDYMDVIENRYNEISYGEDGYGSNIYAICNPIGYYSFIHTLRILSHFINGVHANYKTKKMKLLDIGCGGGAVTRMMWEILGGIYGDVYGLDGSPNRIKHCKEMNPIIDYIQHDIVDEFPYDFKFDGITAFVVLMHLRTEEDIRTALKNINKALADNAMFLWYDTNVDTHFSNYEDEGRGYSKEEMDYFAKDAGFKLIEASTLYRKLPFANNTTLYSVNEANMLKMFVLDRILKTDPVINVRLYKKT